ncbi:hypothetical protein [Methylocystis sp. ATCC 49242]|uniref:hypothetical protein n=1 Tax=Methylocystis sp. ATCC 49242 TaxID=622637 RepID=UPI001FCA7037|nr:hypothetical protein [Methylocystis sp. ATCC 49242]
MRYRTSSPPHSRYYSFIEQQMETVMSAYFDFEVAQETARRQFRISILVVAAMAVAAFVLGFALPISSAQKATPVADGGFFAGRLVGVSE